jgi:hypothetical protein
MSRNGFSTLLLMFWMVFQMVVPGRAEERVGFTIRKNDLPAPAPGSLIRLDVRFQNADGIAFRHPSDWTVAAEANGVGLIPPRPELNEQYRVVILPAVAALGLSDPAHPRFVRELDRLVLGTFPGLKRAGAPESFAAETGGEGAAHRWEAWNPDGFEVQLRKFVVMADGDALCLIAGGPRSLVEKRLPALEAIAGTLTFAPAVAKMTPLVRDWTQILRGHRLVQARARLESRRFDFNGPAAITLAEDGTFVAATLNETPAAVAPPALTGRWRVFERAGAAFLELRADRVTLRFRLDAGNGFTWLDGDPFLAVPVEE